VSTGPEPPPGSPAPPPPSDATSEPELPAPSGIGAAAVRRPVSVLTCVLAVAVFGLLAAQRLPTALLPDLSYPTLTIQTLYPDAAPTSVEQLVTQPLEESVGVIPGLRSLRSVSRAGLSEVILEFDWDEDMDLAALEVRERLGLANLPDESDPPRVLRYDPGLEPMLRVALRGRPLDELTELADRWLEPRLTAVDGVAAVKLRGARTAEVLVEADPERLANHGLTFLDLETALRSEDVNLPGGTLQDYGAVYLVRTLHELRDLETIRQTLVREQGGRKIRVGDVANVHRGLQERVEVSLVDGEEALELALQREGSANPIRAAAAAHRELEAIRSDLPPGTELVVLSDPTQVIERAVADVWSAALIGGLIAILVVYFFLRDLVATAVVAVTIPVSVLATFLPMQQAGVSLNVMSLGGLALGIGMLVDNSIVVLEAIDRRRLQGASRALAAALGVGDVAGAVTAATATTVSVFLPIVFVEGIAGQLFRDLAVTVCFSLLASLVASLTLIPALVALDPGRWLSLSVGLPGPASGETKLPAGSLRLGPIVLLPLGESRGARLAATLLLPLRLVLATSAGLIWAALRLATATLVFLTQPLNYLLEVLSQRYPALLRRALRSRLLLLCVTVGLFALSLVGASQLPQSLVPSLEQGTLVFQLRLPEGTPLERTLQSVRQLQEPLRADRSFARVFATVGSIPAAGSGRTTQGEHLARLDCVLAPGASEAAARARIKSVLGALPNLVAEEREGQALSLSAPVAVDLFCEDVARLEASAARIQSALALLPGLTDVTSTAEAGTPELRIRPLRERAANLGASADTVARALRRQVRGELVGRLRERDRRVDIRLRAGPVYRQRVEAVRRLRVRLTSGEVVPISAVAEVSLERGPAALYHVSGARVARIEARLASDETSSADLSGSLAEVRRVLRAVELPPGVVAELAGQDRELEASFSSLRLALGLAVFLVFVVLAVQFESLRYPLVILLSVPLGAIGVVATLLLSGASLSVLALIGAVLLAGIVVNNAIVLVDAVNRRRRAGEALEDALIAGAGERLRPILMTSATTVLALLPMAIGWGAGNELRAPLAHTVIGGLVGATFLTLLVIPCVYRVFAGHENQPLGARDS